MVKKKPIEAIYDSEISGQLEAIDMRESALGVANDEELARLLLTHSRKLHTILDAADRRIDEGAGIGHDDFWQQVVLKGHARRVNGKVKQSRVKRSY